MLSPNTESGTGGGFGASKGADTNAGGKERSPAKAGLAINERIKDEAADPISALFSSLIGGRIAALFIVLPPHPKKPDIHRHISRCCSLYK
jgi:hypothetical protein